MHSRRSLRDARTADQRRTSAYPRARTSRVRTPHARSADLAATRARHALHPSANPRARIARISAATLSSVALSAQHASPASSTAVQ